MTPAIDTPLRFSPKHPSGVDVIDDTWGGFYRGGAYLVYGRALSGRGLLALMTARAGAGLREKTLYVSSDRQKELFIRAASLGFDLKQAHESGRIRLVRVPTLTEIRYETDDQVAESLTELADMISARRPNRVVLNDFVPFIAFRSSERFQYEFIRFLEKIDSVDATVILVMPEPANARSRRIIEFMGLQMTGSIHIQMVEESPRSTRRRITLIPHIGHIRHRVIDYWDLEDVVDDALTEPSETLGAVEGLEASAHESFAEFEAPDREAPGQASGKESGQAPGEGSSRDPGVAQAPAPGTSGTSPETPPERATTRPEEAIQVTVPGPPGAEPEKPFEPGKTDTTQQPHGADPSDRAAFERRLSGLFAGRNETSDPFLLLAMRMDHGGAATVRPFDFEFLIDLVQEALKADDDFYVDFDDERLIVCLRDARPRDAQQFFARLKESLKQETPLQADHLLQNVSAIVVPDGRPFESVDDFMKYALHES